MLSKLIAHISKEREREILVHKKNSSLENLFFSYLTIKRYSIGIHRFSIIDFHHSKNKLTKKISIVFNFNCLHHIKIELFVYKVDYRWNKLALKHDACQLLLLKRIHVAPEVYHCTYRFC